MERGQRDDGVEFDARLGRLLDDHVREAPAPTDALVVGGLVRGRRMRRRRRTLWGAAAFVGVSAITGTVVLSAGATGGPAAQADGVVIPSFETVAARSGAPAGRTALTGERAVAILRGLLPGEPATSGAAWWDGERGEDQVSAGGRLLLNGGEITVSVQGDFQLTSADALTKDAARAAASASASDQPDKSGASAPDKSAAAAGGGEEGKSTETGKGGEGGKVQRPVTREQLERFYSCDARESADATLRDCDARNVDDGAVLITYEEHQGGLIRRTADLLREDGTRVVLVTANAADAKEGPARTAAPPLTSAQLARVAESGDWQPWVEPDGH